MSIRETLELDLTSALAGLGDLGDALSGIATQFRTDLADALDVLTSVQPVEVTANTETVAPAIDAAVEAADPTAVVTADTSQLEPEIDETVAGLDAVQLEVLADTAGVTAAVEGLASSLPPVDVPVDADTEPAAEKIRGLSEEDVSVDVEVVVESGDAEDDINGLAGAAEAAGTAAGGLNDALLSVATGADATGRSVTDLAASLTSSVPVLGRVVLGLGAVAVAGSGFAVKALEADAATARFHTTFGEFADDVESINIGPLNTSMSELLHTLGSGGTEVRNNLSSFAQLGTAAGASAAQIATASEQLLVLSARAVALNPALGSVGSVVNDLSSALARGGRFTADFGISLTSAEIQTRALQDTGKGATQQLSHFDKAAAGAAIATERYGASLEAVIAAASGNPLLQLRALQTALSATTTELGRPLTAPLFDLLRSGQPLFVDVIALVGQLARTAIPVLTAALSAVAPAVSTVTGALGELLTILGPELADLAATSAQVLAPILQTVAALTPALVPFVEGLAQVALGASLLIDALGPLPVALIGVGAAMVALGITSIPALISALETLYLVMLSHPVLIFATALVGIIGLVTRFNQQSSQAASGQERFRSAMFGTAATLEDTRAKLEGLTRSAATYIATQSDFARSGTVPALLEVGVSAAALTKELDRGAVGATKLIAQLVAAGKVRLSIDGVAQSAGDIRALGVGLDDLIARERVSIDQGRDLVAAIQSEASARNQAAQAQLNTLRLTGQVTEARYQEIVAVVNSAGHTGSYTEALQIATGAQTQAARTAHELAVGLGAITPEVQKAETGLLALLDAEDALVSAEQGVVQAVRDRDDATRAVTDAEEHEVRAARGVVEAQRGVESAVRAVADAHRGEEAAQRSLQAAREREVETLRAVDDATRAVTDAQNALNDALSGPSANEQLAIDSARLALRRAELRVAEQLAGVAPTDVELSPEEEERLRLAEEQRKAEAALLEQEEAGLAVRRAQAELQRAENAQADRARSAAADLASAQERLLEARRQVAPASLAVAEAERGIADASIRVRDAQFGVEGATLRVRDAERQVADARSATEESRLRLAETEQGIARAQDDAARAALDLDGKQRALNAALTDTPGAIEGAVTHLEALRAKYPEVADQLQAYIDKFRGFAPTVAEQGGRDAGTAFVSGATGAITDPSSGLGPRTRDASGFALLGIDWSNSDAVKGATGWVGIATGLLPVQLLSLDGPIGEWARTVPRTIADGIGNVATTLYQKGQEIIEGLINGIMDALHLPPQVRPIIVEAFRQAFKIGSPSKVMIPIGRDIAAGVAFGIEDGATEVVSVAEGIVRDAATALSVPIDGPTLNTGAPGTGLAGGGVSIGQLQVNVQVTGDVSEQRAAEIGQVIGDATIDRLVTAVRIS